MDEDDVMELESQILDQLRESMRDRVTRGQILTQHYTPPEAPSRESQRADRLLTWLRAELGGDIRMDYHQERGTYTFHWRQSDSDVVAATSLTREILAQQNIDIGGMVADDLRRTMFTRPLGEIAGDPIQDAIGLRYNGAIFNERREMLGRVNSIEANFEHDAMRMSPRVTLTLEIDVDINRILEARRLREQGFELNEAGTVMTEMNIIREQMIRDLSMASSGNIIIPSPRDEVTRTTTRAGTVIGDVDLYEHPELSPEPFSISEFFGEE